MKSADADVLSEEEVRYRKNRECLYDRLKPLVRGLIARHGNTDELRQDLPGEIYYQFCKLFDEFDPGRGIPILAYFSRMLPIRVFNYAQTYWRLYHRYVSTEAETLEGTLLDEGENSDDWDDSIHVAQLLQALPHAIATLPRRQRLVLVWRYYDERSFEQIATDLSVQPATVRSLLRHAIRALRTRMAAEGLVDQVGASRPD